MNSSPPKPALAVLWPVNMGNYGQNRLPVQETLERLRHHSQDVQFIACHWRRSGNFVFIDSGYVTRKMALETGKVVTGLTCLVRRFVDLEKVNLAVPPQAQTKNSSVILPTPTGEKKLIHVALSQNVAQATRKIRAIDTRTEILAWLTPQDALCLYDRPAKGGDVGQVTNRVLDVCRTNHPDIYGTGRALSVIRDLLHNRSLRYD